MNRIARAFAGVSACAFLLEGVTWLTRHGVYGFTLFLVAPALLGAIMTVFVPARSESQAFYMGTLAAFLGALFLLMIGAEGAACSLMSLPLSIPAGGFGAWLVYCSRTYRAGSRSAAIFLLIPGVTLGFDTTATPPIYEVSSSVEIAASPEQVWKHVVTFSDLPEPTEWYFRAGIAYPKRAHIEGTGPGAVRYCEFSTGPFVEPIDVWDEPRKLAFRVTQNPAPMREWSPYAEVLPKHLHGYLVSKHGQFQLTRPQPEPHAARRDNVVSARAVAGAILAVVVGRDHPSHPYARAGTHPHASRSRCARRLQRAHQVIRLVGARRIEAGVEPDKFGAQAHFEVILHRIW